jgi:proteasome lid subunit RPN8/RPN11
MPSIIHINDQARQVMNEHAKATFPYECCGFLYGTDNENGRQITEAIIAPNSKKGDQRRRFEISPLDYMKAEQYALQHETQFLGIYHSHPNHPAIASEHDLAKAMPFFSYVIVSVMEGEVADTKSWKLKEDERVFLEEEVTFSIKSTTF